MHGPVFLTAAALLSLFGTMTFASPMRETADTMSTLRRLLALRLRRSNINYAEDDQVTSPRTVEAANTTPVVHQLISERLSRIFEYSSDDDRTGRNFPEVDERGFDEDVFDEGFGEWEPMKRF